MSVLWILAALVALWFVVHWSFVAIMSAKAVRARGDLSTYWTVMLAPLAIASVVLDVAFNLTFGTLMYREWPREWLFTTRCRRHAGGEGPRRKLAHWWAVQLNAFDPNHIRL